MKIVEKFRQIGKQSGNRKGVALVTVLTVMSLATILILTFFSLAQSEHRASATYSQGLQAQQVAEQAVNMVIAQIREATVGDTAWASQPGVLRTWDENGDFAIGYKLYSDDQLQTKNETDLVDTDFDDIQSWSSLPDVYVDLNEPVIRGKKIYYPIVDPIARDLPTWPKQIGNDDRGIEGFDYNTGSGGSSNKELSSLKDAGPMRDAVKNAVTGSTGGEVLPMPVKWIYQLSDGTTGTIDQTSEGQPGKFNAFEGSVSPTAENPIVARFAYWADDETSKLNVNVHAGGLAWDIPKAGGDMDMKMGQFQPAQHEWQRYPGHPATTHMIPVLAPGVIDIVNDRDAMDLIFNLVPRVVGGGSESGTRKVDPRKVEERNGLIADKDPLFPSVDEFLFRPDRSVAEFPSASGRPIRDYEEVADRLERSKFFLTVTSRAPETTLFNTPRISMWPIYNAERSGNASSDYQKRLTPFDRLIHFCSTLGTNSSGRADYIFRRENADSSTFDYENIQRNKDLYAYLDALMGQDVPGYGESFRDKYGSDQQRQILTEIFDYIRCTNLHDDSLFGEDWEDAMMAGNTDDHLTYTNPRADRKNYDVIGEDLLHKGLGQVTPIKINKGGTETKGFGRFYTLSEASIYMICCAQAGNPAGGGTLPLGGVAITPRYPGITKYGGGFYEQPINEPMFSHIPPLPSGVALNYNTMTDPEKAAARLTWPNWLQQYPDTDPLIAGSAPGAGGVFDPASWNWHLCWLANDNFREQPYGNRGSVPNTDEVRLDAGEKLVQAAMLFHLFTPSLGWIPINPDMMIDINIDSSVEFQGVDGGVKFENGGSGRWATNRRQSAWHDRHYGGTKPISYQLSGPGSTGRYTPLDAGWSDSNETNQYPWVTKPFRIADNEVNMTGGKISFEIWSADSAICENSASQDSTPDKIQSIVLEFPDISGVEAPGLTAGRPGYYNEFGAIQSRAIVPMELWSLTKTGVNPQVASTGRMERINGGNGIMLSNEDLVQSMNVGHSDYRIAAARSEIAAGEIFEPHWLYSKARMAHSLSLSPGWSYAGYVKDSDRAMVTGIEYGGKSPVTITGKAYTNSSMVQRYGDFDNGPGLTVDGPYINKPDEGNTHSLFNRTDNTRIGSGMWEFRRDYGDFPYFVRDWIHEAGSPSYFSPNRIVNGPGMLGSLSTGSVDNEPWRTLLFRPDIVSNGNGYEKHPGAEDPPDHLIMDLFWMPVVEPYAISESLSTGGKVNLNYQMLPFRHIERSTALRGVFKSEFMLCLPTPNGKNRSRIAKDYKVGAGRGRGYHWRDRPYGGNLQKLRLRTVILEDETLDQFFWKFDREKEIFKAASEVTTMHLVPQQVADRMGLTSFDSKLETYTPKVTNGKVPDMDSGKYWSEHAIVGDNGRERPYANIYSRVTTKSNTFKVHYRAQVLKQSRRDEPSQYASWNPLVDSVVGEYRGSTIVERYVEPNDPEIPDYGSSTDPSSLPSLGEFYKFRIVNPTRFAP